MKNGIFLSKNNCPLHVPIQIWTKKWNLILGQLGNPKRLSRKLCPHCRDIYLQKVFIKIFQGLVCPQCLWSLEKVQVFDPKPFIKGEGK